jgi:hypothetical protein
MKILLVAKPWKGGLGRYYFAALQALFPGEVEWIATRPCSLKERIAFRCDPQGWRRALIRRINESDYAAAIFISHRKEFRDLKPRANNILYLIDDVHLMPGDAAPFGRVFLSDPGYEPELLAVLQPGQYGGVLPFAFDPALHCPAPFAGTKRDICFIGNRDAKRDPYLASLFAQGYRPLIVGNYFMKSRLFWYYPLSFRLAVANDGMGMIYARHKISLNIHARVVRQGTNMRTFECAGYGIPQVVEYREGIEKYFEPDQEILFYRDEAEMLAQIRFLLEDSSRAALMAEKARHRALAEHTYRHRVQTLLRDILPVRYKAP